MDTAGTPQEEPKKPKPNGAGGNVKATDEGGPKGLGKITSIEDIKAETLLGDVRDMLLQELRDTKQTLPWNLRGEKDQREAIERIDRFARNLITQCVQKIAANGEHSIRFVLKKWEVTDALKVALEGSPTTESIMTLCNGGKFVTLTFSDTEQFEGEREPITAAPDQRRMFGGDDRDDDGPVFDNTDSGNKPKN